MDNRVVAYYLTQRARALDRNAGNLYRVRAYRRAAETILGLDEPVEIIFWREGRGGLKRLPGIGTHISTAIETLVRTGSLPTTTALDK